jgi:hypothetical protein
VLPRVGALKTRDLVLPRVGALKKRELVLPRVGSLKKGICVSKSWFSKKDWCPSQSQIVLYKLCNSLFI